MDKSHSEEYLEEYLERNTTGTTVIDNGKCNICCFPLDKNKFNRNNKRCNKCILDLKENKKE